ncbi:MAG: PrsW family intramembrane metalloprotease [Clostridiales bacterium]|nr:PrsW family intramembrane metalloprotease [Candidatus Equinaster intestinalis]
MAELILILFVCFFIPMIMALFLVRGESKVTLLFMIIGIFVCLFASYINGFAESISVEFTRKQLTYIVTPVVEEVLKAIPIVIFVFMFKPKKEHLLSCAMMLGIGFSVLENAYILASNIDTVTLSWAIIRGFGASFMHGISTLMVGYGLSYISVRKKLAITGTYGLLILATMYHACFNLLIQSDYRFYGILMPTMTFLPIVLIFTRKKRRLAKESGVSKNEN